jgi:hypothetical protein
MPVGCTQPIIAQAGSGDDGRDAMVDELSTYYADLLDGSYDCVDRIVLIVLTA